LGEMLPGQVENLPRYCPGCPGKSIFYRFCPGQLVPEDVAGILLRDAV